MTTNLNPADLGDGAAYPAMSTPAPSSAYPIATPPIDMDDLLAQVAAAQAAVEEEAEKPLTLADLAAAAFTALETIVTILGGPTSNNGSQVIDEFERRSQAFAESLELEG